MEKVKKNLILLREVGWDKTITDLYFEPVLLEASA